MKDEFKAFSISLSPIFFLYLSPLRKPLFDRKTVQSLNLQFCKLLKTKNCKNGKIQF